MDSPTSRVISKTKLKKSEQLISKKFKHKIKNRLKYVEDILSTIGKKNNVTKILDELNLIHQNNNFIIEREKNNTLNNLETTVCIKAKSSTKIMNAKYKISYSYKKANFKPCINIAITQCSCQKLLREVS